HAVHYAPARKGFINRLAMIQSLPQGVNPQISPFPPTGELVRFSLEGPRQPLLPSPSPPPDNPFHARYTRSDRPGWAGREVYSLLDLKSLEDWVVQRAFRRLPRIADVTSFGGMVKRYEICPDPDDLKRYGITLGQFQNAVSNSNANVGAGFVRQGGTAQNVRALGLLGNGEDPMVRALTLPGARQAERHLRREE